METQKNLEKALEQAKKKAIKQLRVIDGKLFAYDYNAGTWNIADALNVAVKDCGAIHTVFLGIKDYDDFFHPEVDKINNIEFFLIGMEEE